MNNISIAVPRTAINEAVPSTANPEVTLTTRILAFAAAHVVVLGTAMSLYSLFH